jgi:glycosyltransferase involved in cell wall biosynthesis
MTRPIRIALYGDVDLNILDGSAIWLASLAEVLAGHPRVELEILLKAPETRDLITGPLHGLPRVHLRRPPGAEARLTQAQAVAALVELDREQPFDAVIIRGRRVAAQAASSSLAGRLWCYLTDIPQSVAELTDDGLAEIVSIVAASGAVLAQTEELRSYLEGICPTACGRTILLPPMVPPVFEAPRHERPTDRPLRLFYAGKFAPMWGFLEAVDAFRRLQQTHPTLEFHVVGDKVHNPPDDPLFAKDVNAALRSGDGLVWHGGTTREAVAELLADADVALSARDAAMSNSLELSTKLLEYGAAGVPVIMNRTEMHTRLYGDDYPLFVNDLDDLDTVLLAAIESTDRWARARDRVADVADEYAMAAIRTRLAPHLERLAPAAPASTHTSTRPPRVLVAGHDLQFFHAIEAHLSAAGADVRIDKWDGHEAHDEPASRDALRWADVIVCEWSLGNAEWYADRCRDGQRLIVRFHRQELETAYPARLATEAVDTMVFVSKRVQRDAIEQFGWRDLTTEVIPNAVDTLALDRPKLPGAEYNLALIGLLPRLKGLSRALDIMVELRRHDPRYRLSLAGSLPWEKPWVWARSSERQYFSDQLDRVRTHRLLGDAISFDGHTRDISGWLRKVGVILSMSDLESFHLGLAEGMASRAVPVIRPWDGSAELYTTRWIRSTPQAAAAWLLEHSADAQVEGEAAREHIRRNYNRDHLHHRWTELVLG